MYSKYTLLAHFLSDVYTFIYLINCLIGTNFVMSFLYQFGKDDTADWQKVKFYSGMHCSHMSQGPQIYSAMALLGQLTQVNTIIQFLLFQCILVH